MLNPKFQTPKTKSTNSFKIALFLNASSPSFPKVNTKAVIALVLCCAFWGISFPMIKAMMIELSDHSPDGSTLFFSSWIQFMRFLLAGIIMFFLTMRLSKPTRLEIRQGLTLALLPTPKHQPLPFLLRVIVSSSLFGPHSDIANFREKQQSLQCSSFSVVVRYSLASAPTI